MCTLLSAHLSVCLPHAQLTRPHTHCCRYKKLLGNNLSECESSAEICPQLPHALSHVHGLSVLRSPSVYFGEIAPHTSEISRVQDDLYPS